MWARTPVGFVVALWYPMNRTAAKLESMPSIIIRGRGHDRTICTSLGNFSISRFSPLPCESEITNSVAPAARAPSIAARTSLVMNARKRSYSKPGGPSWSEVTTPATPSMSAEM